VADIQWESVFKEHYNQFSTTVPSGDGVCTPIHSLISRPCRSSKSGLV